MYGMLLPSTDQVSPTLSSNNGQDPPPMSLAPPPPGEFESREELLEYLKEWGKMQGFAVVIGRSRNNRLWIKCDRGGEYADKHVNDPENRKRKRKATRLTGCEFKIKANLKKDNIWRCQTENPNHNHPPSEDLSLHPSIRRMNDDQLAKVNEMTEAGKTPVETLEELRRLWPDLPVLKRDIYNARKKYKTEKEQRETEDAMEPAQPYEDPNGRIAGPTRTGRWEWLEDGDEIKRKKKRTKSAATAQESTPTMDTHDEESPPIPTIGLPSQPAQPLRSSSSMNAMSNTYHQGGLSPRSATSRIPETDFNPSLGYGAQSTRPFRHYQAPNPQTIPHRNYNQPSMNANTDPLLQSTIPPRGRQPDMTNVTPMMTSMMQAISTAGSVSMPTPTTKPAPQSGQVLMSRIERMEREQIEHKNILSQILNAVQGASNVNRR